MTVLKTAVSSFFALTLFTSASLAEIMGSATARDTFVFGGLERWPLPGMVVGPFFLQFNETFAATFSSVCSVDAPAGVYHEFSEVNLQVVNAAGKVVYTLRPTANDFDPFCASNGTPDFDGFETNAVSAVAVGHRLPAGEYSLKVTARNSHAGVGSWYGVRSLIVWK